MSLMGIDVGTTGCKVAVFSVEGSLLAQAYREYPIERPGPGHAELDACRVWRDVKSAIQEATAQTTADPITALSVGSLGEAVVPISADRKILGPSLLNADARGEEYLPALSGRIDPSRLYEINGNTLGNHFTLTKLLWTRAYLPEIYEETFKFFHWGACVAFLLGGEPYVDYCLANRTLLFDLEHGKWSEELARWAGFGVEKLPEVVPPGTVTGTVSAAMAKELGLPKGVGLVSGAHDQCVNALGCGVLNDGQAMFGMGTVFCATPVFSHRPSASSMIPQGLNTEHHAVPGRHVCFIYNEGGSLLKWYRDTFAADEHQRAQREGRNVYETLLDEVPDTPSSVLVLPHFSPTGPPEFIADSSGAVLGLRLDTRRAEILRGLMEGAVFYLRACLDGLPQTGIHVDEFRAVGGGSHSDTWLQICADIFGRTLTRTGMPEAGALGAALLAGSATGVYGSLEEAVSTAVRLGQRFVPNPGRAALYQDRYARYLDLWPSLRDILRRPI